MRLASTYRGFRRNVLRVAGLLRTWATAPVYQVIHKVKAWVDEKNDKGIWQRVYRDVQHYTLVHETFRTALLRNSERKFNIKPA